MIKYTIKYICSYALSMYSIREQILLGSVSLKDYKFIWKNENERNESKIILGYFNCTINKMDRYDENKTQRFYRCCSNYSLIAHNGLCIYGEGRTKILLSSPTMIGLLARIQDTQDLY